MRCKPVHRVFLDEFGQLGRMDRLADSITLLRGRHGLWRTAPTS